MSLSVRVNAKLLCVTTLEAIWVKPMRENTSPVILHQYAVFFRISSQLKCACGIAQPSVGGTLINGPGKQGDES